MNRRNALAGAGMALTTSLAGCLGTFGGDDPDDDDSTDPNETNGNETDPNETNGTTTDPNETGPNETDPNESDPDQSGDAQESSADADSVPVLEKFTVSEETTVPAVERDGEMSPWGVFVASRDVATRYFEPDSDETPDAVAAFVEETAFDDGERLLFVEAWGPQTCYELRLGADPRVGENGLTQVELDVDRTAGENQACGDAMTAVHLLLRLSYDPDGPDPDVVSVTVGGDAASPEKFEVEADR